MLKKLILIFVALSILFFSFQKVHAGVIINGERRQPGAVSVLSFPSRILKAKPSAPGLIL
ncbi:hypothetical protein HYZ82_01885 [Candidatus Nomurabacteria bacterium]|nr:hypothetical protein [Candidatus Nomurabacteria bacterium]